MKSKFLEVGFSYVWNFKANAFALYCNYVTDDTLANAYALLVSIKNKTPNPLQSDENGESQDTSKVSQEVLEQQAQDKYGRLQPFVKPGEQPMFTDSGMEIIYFKFWIYYFLNFSNYLTIHYYIVKLQTKTTVGAKQRARRTRDNSQGAGARASPAKKLLKPSSPARGKTKKPGAAGKKNGVAKKVMSESSDDDDLQQGESTECIANLLRAKTENKV